MMLKIEWNNQHEKISKIPWHTPTTFQQFCNWMKSRETSRISNESEYKFYHSTQNVGSMINLMCFLDSSHFSNQLSCT